MAKLGVEALEIVYKHGLFAPGVNPSTSPTGRASIRA
jgi:hypothetical protein